MTFLYDISIFFFNFASMRNSNNSSKPIKQFCFINDGEFKNESVLIAGNATYSHCQTLNCYSISEASNEIKIKYQQNFLENDVSIESIFETGKNKYLILFKKNSPEIQHIAEFTYIPSKSIMMKNEDIFQTTNSNSKISFCFPIPKTKDSYQTVYAVDNKLYIYFGGKKAEIGIKLQNPILTCGTYIDNNTLALGVGSNLLIYDIRDAWNNKPTQVYKSPMHGSYISTISANHLDKNILYTGGLDGFAKQIDIRNCGDYNTKHKCVYEVCTGLSSFPQCPVVLIAPNPIDKTVFATASSGNSSYGYITIFKNGINKYYSKPTEPPKNKQTHEEALISATNNNKTTWIDWSNSDPSLLVSVDMSGQFKTHYFTDFDFGGMLDS